MTGISGTPTTCLRLSFSCSAFPFLIRSTTDWKHMPPITRLSRLLTILARLPGGSSPRVQRLPFRLFARSFVRSFVRFVSFRFVSFAYCCSTNVCPGYQVSRSTNDKNVSYIFPVFTRWPAMFRVISCVVSARYRVVREEHV